MLLEQKGGGVFEKICRMFIGNESHERPVSPIFIMEGKNPQMCRNGLQDGILKINRIPLVRTAVVHLLRAESPSCIWVRLTNHITDKLVLSEPLTQRCSPGEDDLTRDEYCLAPIDDKTYGRCRVLHITDSLIKVFFIDEGTSAWLVRNCLAKMPKELAYHPWQAIQVSLCGVKMRKFSRFGTETTAMWSEEECISFRQLLSIFPLLKTRTVKSSIIHNDYRRPVQVELYGIPEGYSDTSLEVGISIAALFSAKQHRRLRVQRIANAADYVAALNAEEKLTPPQMEDIPSFRKHFPLDRRPVPDKDLISLISEKIREWKEWTPAEVRIPPLELDWLDKNGYRNDAFSTDEYYLINIEGAQTRSPYEFYARPIRRKLVRIAPNEFNSGEEEQLQSETEAMLNAHNELCKRATDLDTFYSIEDNRSPLDSNECANWLKANLRVFAICACSEERAAYTGEWQRVEVLSCNDFANVLFLDSGGTELVVPHSLYKIHPMHCTYPPMCMQLCMCGVGPSRADGSLEWSEGSKAEWRKLLREDLPMSISVLKRLNAENDNKVLQNDEPAWHRPGVLFVKYLKVHGEKDTVLKKFCSPSRHPNNGIYQEDMPCQWL